MLLLNFIQLWVFTFTGEFPSLFFFMTWAV